MYSVNGKILRINLSNKNIDVEKMSEKFYRKYYGGRNVIAYFLLKETLPNIDPLGEDNKLIFATGALTGCPFPGSGKHSIGAKSPLTGFYGDGEAGGFWGHEFKKTGFDALIVEGKSPKPVYILIKDNEIKIEDANGLWGKTTSETYLLLREKLGNKVRIASIGPAGENLTRYACISHDLRAFVGRSGIGAVMGSKNLKAVVVKGSKFPDIYDKKKVKELSSYMNNNFMDMVGMLSQFGTLAGVKIYNDSGCLPTKNFTGGSFDGVESISADYIMNKYKTVKHGCYACPIKCRFELNTDKEDDVKAIYGTPEYETVAAFGSNLDIKDIDIIMKANELCNEYGLDTISTGVVISFAMECFERGLISEKDTGGIKLKFGDGNFLKMIEEIAYMRNFGKILGQGVHLASKRIGQESFKYAVHVKGQEAPLQEPRAKKGLGLGYAISPTGADHAHNVHDNFYEKETRALEILHALGYSKPLPATSLNPEKAVMLKYASAIRYLADCIGMCYFVPWNYLQLEELVKSNTGWNSSTAEMMKVVERSLTLTRIYNIREGLNAYHDTLPKRFEEPLQSGPLKGEKIDKKELEIAKKTFYKIQGWNENGIPNKETLHDLDLSWILSTNFECANDS